MSNPRHTVSQLFEIPDASHPLQNQLNVENEIAHGKFGSVFIAEVDREFDIPRASIRPSLQPAYRQSNSGIQPTNHTKTRPSNTVFLFEKSKNESDNFEIPLSRQSIAAIERKSISRSGFSHRMSPNNVIKTYNQKLSIATKPEKVAMKTQIIKKPNEKQETSYVECRIFKALAKLMAKRYCNNFIYMYQWFKSFVEEEEIKRPQQSIQQISFIMEYAEITFAERKRICSKQLMEMQELKEIIFQVIWALMVAQNELNFMHNDLHSKNIMINKSKKDHYYFNPIDNTAWKTCCVVVKICDFGSSRIEIQNEIIGKGQELFDEMTDRIKFCESLTAFKFTENDHLKEDKKLLTDFKSLLKNGKNKFWGLNDLLYHPFFDSLRVNPKFSRSMSVYSYKFDHPKCHKQEI